MGWRDGSLAVPGAAAIGLAPVTAPRPGVLMLPRDDGRDEAGSPLLLTARSVAAGAA